MLPIILACVLALSEASAPAILRKTMPEDGLLNFTQLVEKYGQKCEEFDVETEDGYILKLFHITGNESKKPVLLMHGIIDSSDAFVIRGKNSTCIKLAEAGYDVWLGNVRGNKYSRKHVRLSPEKDNKKFFDFSFHEMGKYDLPAIIDFILEKTGKSKLSTIGFSQGTSTHYAFGSERPEYNKKISVHISLAPIAYFNHIGKGLSTLIAMWPELSAYFKGVGYEDILQDSSKLDEAVRFICTQGHIAYDFCEKGIMASVAGDDSEEMPEEFFRVLIGHFPAGTSRKAFDHYAQIRNSARFAQYDYGFKKNMQLYKSALPPLYNLANITMPVVLMVGKNDLVADVKDVERLKNELPNVVDHHVMEREKFNHMDFVWAEHVNVYVNPLLKQYLMVSPRKDAQCQKWVSAEDQRRDMLLASMSRQMLSGSPIGF